MLTSMSVGVFHFFMPLLGNYLGNIILKFININPNYILSILLTILLIAMIKNYKEEVETINFNFISIIIFSFFVSMDSFTVGIGLKAITNIPLIACSIFTIISGTCTFLGFILGKYLNNKITKISKVIGIIIIFTLIIYFLCQ